MASKTGEGSHGGHIIGHTKGGKPIYAPGYASQGGVETTLHHSDVKMHGYSAEDHKDAIKAHMKASGEHQEQYADTHDHYHRAMSDAHYTAASNHHIALHGDRLLGERPSPVRRPAVSRTWKMRKTLDDGFGNPVRLMVKSELTAKKRKHLHKESFALPESRGYPIHDEVHARNALARVAQHGTPEEQRKVRRAVKRKYPHIEVGGEEDHDEGEPATIEPMQKVAVDGPSSVAPMTMAEGKTPKESRQWDHVFQSEQARGLDQKHAAMAAWGAVKRGRMSKALPPGVSVVRLSKSTAQGIVAIDESMFSGLTALTPPEVVPGTVLEDDKGNVIRGVFRIGPYQAEYVQLNGKLPYCTIAGAASVPFTMIVSSWADAQTKALRACDAFVRGVAAPDEGVFQHVGSRVAVKWPGVST